MQTTRKKVERAIPAPVMIDPLKDVLPVARAPSKLALVKLACSRDEICNLGRKGLVHYDHYSMLTMITLPMDKISCSSVLNTHKGMPPNE